MMGPILRFLFRPRNAVVLVACLVTTAAVVIARAPLADPDVWWVSAAGRTMFETGEVITRNTFSYTEPAHSWVMHEWGLGLLYAWGLTQFGPGFFVACSLASLLGGTALLAVWVTREASQPSAALGVLFVLFACFAGRFVSARPSGIALAFPIAIGLLAFEGRFSVARAALAVLLEALWTNCHGSFPLGPVILCVAAADRVTHRRLRLVTAGLMASVTLLNPYGLRLHALVLDYLLGRTDIYREIHAHIVEFRPIWGAWGRTAGPVEVVGLSVFAVLCLVALGRPKHRVRGAFCLALIFGAVLNARHIELAGVLSGPLLLPVLEDRWSRWQLPNFDTPAHWRRRLKAATLVPAAFAGVVMFGGTLSERAAEDWSRGGRPFLALLDRARSKASVYVPFQFSGIAIWYGAPRGLRVFYDARNDCYSPETQRAFFDLQRPDTSAPALRTILDDTHTGAVVVPVAHRLVAFLARESNWRKQAQAASWVLYERSGP